MRALAFVVALLWASIGLAVAQQTGTPAQGTADQGAAAQGAGGAAPAGGAPPPPPAADQVQPAAPSGAATPPAGATAPPSDAAIPPAGDQGQPATRPAGPPAGAPTGEPSIDAQAAELLKKLTARQFDGRLPETPLPDWLAQQLGKRAELQWTTGDCGDEGGEPDTGQAGDGTGGAGTSGGTSSGNADVTLCSEAQALFYDASGKPGLDRYVVLQLRVGNRRLGVTDDPSGFGPDALTIFVFDGSSNRTLFRLGDLPGVLASIN